VAVPDRAEATASELGQVTVQQGPIKSGSIQLGMWATMRVKIVLADPSLWQPKRYCVHLAVEAVSCEPVSNPRIPCWQGKYRETQQFGLQGPEQKSSSFSSLDSTSVAARTGNLLVGTGKVWLATGSMVSRSGQAHW